MPRRILFLDDRSKRIHSALKKFHDCDLTIVTNVVECLCSLSNNDYDEVYLDHDLNGEEFMRSGNPNSGMEVVEYIVENVWPEEKLKPLFIIHSSNIFGATSMEQCLKRNGFQVLRKRWTYDE